MQRTLKLLPQPGNPRNSEGAFIELRDGRLLFVYSHFTGGAQDHAAAHLAGRVSADGGLTWADEDSVVVAGEGRQNVMSASLLRLPDNRIALFYLRKNSSGDCRPVVRFSDDEAQTWTAAKVIVPDTQTGYYVLNNDRVIRLQSGRLIVPLARHDFSSRGWAAGARYGTIMCCYSDDDGCSWQRSETQLNGSPSNEKKSERVLLQEPGIVEMTDGRVMMFCRTDRGRQYISFSGDKGATWTPFEPSNIISPLSPASIKRVPGSGDLLLVWNDHRNITPGLAGKRTPLCVAVSGDEGATWRNERILEDNPHGWYCYTAVHFLPEHVLLAYCAGDTSTGNGLAVTQVARFPLEWLCPGCSGAKSK